MTGQGATPHARRNPRAALVMALLDVAAPLAMFYGMRWAGVDQWLALVVSGAVPLLMLAYRSATERRLEMLALFTLSILVCGTAVGLITGDPRLLLARESYLTGLVGLWMIRTLWGNRPFALQATLPLLPGADAQSSEDDWQHDASFRQVMRTMTLAWGGAFLVDAVARVVMAYTLPVDVVPLLGVLLLVAMLTAVVAVSKVYGRRLLVAGPATDRLDAGTAQRRPTDEVTLEDEPGRSDFPGTAGRARINP